MADSRLNKPLGAGKKYHYSVLYNYYEGPPSGREGDHLLSWNFLKAMEEKLYGHGYDQVMYHDIAVAGSNIFDNLFTMVNESEKIVVLLTHEFLSKGWHKYSQQAANINLLDKNEANTRFIPIAINLDKRRIPENLGLSNKTIIYTRYNNDKVDDSVWDAILKAMGRKEVHYVQTQTDDKLSEEINNSTEDKDMGRGKESSESCSEHLTNPTNLSHGPVDSYSSICSPMCNAMPVEYPIRDSKISNKTDLEQSEQSAALIEGNVCSFAKEPISEVDTSAIGEPRSEGNGNDRSERIESSESCSEHLTNPTNLSHGPVDSYSSICSPMCNAMPVEYPIRDSKISNKTDLEQSEQSAALIEGNACSFAKEPISEVDTSAIGEPRSEGNGNDRSERISTTSESRSEGNQNPQTTGTNATSGHRSVGTGATSEPRPEGTSATREPRTERTSATIEPEGDKLCQSNTSSNSATADSQPQSRDSCCLFL